MTRVVTSHTQIDFQVYYTTSDQQQVLNFNLIPKKEKNNENRRYFVHKIKGRIQSPDTG